MFLSLLELNPRSRQVQAELRDPYQLHRTLSKAFGDDPEAYDEARCLFRIDEKPDSGKPFVLFQSRVSPDWSCLDNLSGYASAPVRVKEFLPSLSEGQRLHFRLRANPTVKRDGKRIGIYREEEQLKWLARKAEQGGFRILSVIVKPDRKQVSKTSNGLEASFASAVFDGVLQITDVVMFLAVLEAGIGPAKGFGYGLLSIAPA